MTNDETINEMDASGLRYKSKANGSPFGMAGASGGTMSCYKCGQHKPRSLGAFKKFVDRRMFICGECQTSAKS